MHQASAGKAAEHAGTHPPPAAAAAGAASSATPVSAPVVAPRSARWTLRTVVGVLFVGALWLAWVRREAIIADLATFAAWCF